MKAKNIFIVITMTALAATTYAVEKPNIIIIYGDDIGYGDFSCYGGIGVDTYNVDQLAAGGIRFLSGYSAASTCTPSRYSLLTGEHAFRNQSAQVLPGNAPLIIGPEQPTIASFLRDNGYATALVGKWHLGLGSADEPLNWNGEIKPGPKEVGFDYSFYMAATADRVPSVYIENGRIVNLDPKDPVQVSYREKVGDEPTGISHPHLLKFQADEQHSGTIVNGISRIGFMTGGKKALFKDEDMADAYLNKAIKFVRQNKNKPFFLYYAPNECHVPRVLHRRFQNSTSLGPRGDAVAAFDWCVGRLIETLKEQGLYENTLIVVSSDNGPVLFDGYWEGAMEKNGEHKPSGPWHGGKYSRWEGGTRMPFIVSWPEKVKPSISNAIVSHLDMFESITVLIGEPMPEGSGTDGQNVLPALLGESPKGRNYVIYEAFGKTIAIRKGDWKYMPPGSLMERGGIGKWNKTMIAEPGLLFYLPEDPGEQRNLAGQYPEKLEELREILNRVAPEKMSVQPEMTKGKPGFH